MNSFNFLVASINTASICNFYSEWFDLRSCFTIPLRKIKTIKSIWAYKSASSERDTSISEASSLVEIVCNYFTRWFYDRVIKLKSKRVISEFLPILAAISIKRQHI